ncbi:MAG: hypothetical protein U9N86_02795 [Bacteroidota bacterium]|nr:hypothetical protein [Bacteroidota bacterium]
MKEKSILLFIVLTVFLGSCELIDPIFNPVKNECILLKTSMSVPNDPANEETVFTYDSSGKLIEVVKTGYDLGSDPVVSRWTMTYSNDKLDKLSSFFKFYSDPEEKTGDWMFYYNGNLPDSIHAPAASASNNVSYTLTQYTGDKLVKLTDYLKRPNEPNYSVFNTTDLEWSGDNISKITITNNYGSSRFFEYEYDDKKTPLGHLGLALSSFGSLTMLSKNNVTKTTYTLGTNVYISETSYTYNSTDYPISAIPAKDGYPTNYEYDCK